MLILQEIQTTNNQTSLLPAETYIDRNTAESAFHLKLSSAAISNVEIHTVILYDEYGNIIRREYYEHFNDTIAE